MRTGTTSRTAATRRSKPPCSDAAVLAKTGRDWKAWRRLLDSKGAARLAHRDLARLVARHHRAGEWWSQMVAVGYERLRGKRALYGRSDGSFTGNVSRTVPMTARSAHAFFVQRGKRSRWLRARLTIRGARAPKSVRITWPDETSVDVRITAKKGARCVVAVEHSRLKTRGEVAKRKAFWKAALRSLENLAI